MSCIMIMAGGTGGHIFPALSVAHALQTAGCKVVWLGSRGGMEESLVPRAGIEGEWISISGVRGKKLWAKLVAPFKIVIAITQALRIIHRRQPNAVLGLGGFASGPGGIAAWMLRRPLIIHEQNAVAGSTNKILARFATKVFAAFPHSFTAKVDAEVVGNPVRQEIVALPIPANRLKNRQGPLRILVLGGSRGALTLNQYVPSELALVHKVKAIEVRHQAGELTYDQTLEIYRTVPFTVTVEKFITDMASAYAWADIAICRAGALTVAELSAAGLGSILIPFPFAIDDHQTANARYLEDVGAARILQQSEFSSGALSEILLQLATTPERLIAMAEAARQLALPHAVDEVANSCLRLAAGVTS